MGEREFHSVSGLFPLLQGKAFEELVDDIRTNGLREPILVDDEGRILDGRNRYRACREARVEPRFVQWQAKGSPVDLTLSLNLRRRHLNESQRALVAARLANLSSADLHSSQREPSTQKAADLVNVSLRLVRYAQKLLNHGCDELIAAVESGRISVWAASRLAGLAKDEQAKAVAGGPAGMARKAKEMRCGEPAAGREEYFFGIILRSVSSQIEGLGDARRLLWVDAPGLSDAMNALRDNGFRLSLSGLDTPTRPAAS